MRTTDNFHSVGQGQNLATSDALVMSLAATLRQLHDLIGGLTDRQYTCVPSIDLRSSIGGHVRHSLDHVAALLDGLPTGNLNYDQRERGTPTEVDRRAGMSTLHHFEMELLRRDWHDLPETISLTFLPSADSPVVAIPTTPARELSFVLSHTVHHNALIAVIASMVGAAIPPGFGYAPATIAYQRTQSCAP